jgi:hypothetical protein
MVGLTMMIAVDQLTKTYRVRATSDRWMSGLAAVAVVRQRPDRECTSDVEPTEEAVVGNETADTSLAGSSR